MKTANVRHAIICLLGSILLLIPVITNAQIPQEVSYQGYLTDTGTGDPVDTAGGTIDIEFSLYDAASGGIPLWTGMQSVAVKQGVYSVTFSGLGGLDFDSQYYLQVAVDENANSTIEPAEILSPRQVFSAVPYALNADRIDGQHAADLGDITAVNPGTGLSGGGDSGGVTLDVQVPLSLSGSTASPGGIINGTNSSTGSGVYGINTTNGSYGTLGGYNNGVTGYGPTNGVYGNSDLYGVSGYSFPGTGVYGSSNSGKGVEGYSNSGYGVYGSVNSAYGWAGYFSGKVRVTGNLTVDGTVSGPNIGDITGVTAGTGLTGGGDSGGVTLDVDTSAIQQRITGTCAAGSSIRVVNADGTVTCETYSVQVPLSLSGSAASPGGIINGTNSGTGYGVYGNNTSSNNYGGLGSAQYGVYGYGLHAGSYGVYGRGYDPGTYGVYGAGDAPGSYGVYGESFNGVGVYGKSSFGWAGLFEGSAKVTGNLTVNGTVTGGGIGDITGVTAGTGLTGGGTSGGVTLDVDTTAIQRRITGTCAAGSSIRVISATGAVTCEAETDPMVNALAKASLSCSNGQVAKWNGTIWACANETDPEVGTNITNYVPKWNGSALVTGSIYDNGNVGIGTPTPHDKFEINGSLRLDSGAGNGNVIRFVEDNVKKWAILYRPWAGNSLGIWDEVGSKWSLFFESNTGRVGIGTTTPGRALEIEGDLQVNGWTYTQMLQITGGADLAEPFNVGDDETILPGMVVSIDPDNPGKLRLSHEPYDKKVAGIISGAGGIQPGMLMGQKGTAADGDIAIALSGRVYCMVDASRMSVDPGDLLTTSEIPGHAMKVVDSTKAQGAIIGKAMSSLESGTGLVLVLVTLQ